MTLHPLTQIIIVFEIALLTFTMPALSRALIVSAGFLAAVLIPSRTDVRLTRPFIKILTMAALFLFLINCVRLRTPGIVYDGILTGFEYFINIFIPFTGVLYLSRRIQSEELFALFIDLRVPPAIILILFRTLWLVPRLMERMDAAVVAHKLRGMRVETAVQRAQVIIPTLSSIFSSMFDEISQNSVTLTTRGFLHPCRKTHILTMKYRLIDLGVVMAVTGILIVIWL